MDDNKYNKVITKLNRLTIEKRIKWKEENPPKYLVEGTDDHISFFYTTEYEGQRFCLYELRNKSYDDVCDSVHWQSRLFLGLYDKNSAIIWDFPPVSGLRDLQESIKYQIVNVDEALDKILSA